MNKGEKLIRRMTIVGIMIGVATVVAILNIGASAAERETSVFLVHPKLAKVEPDYMAGMTLFGGIMGGGLSKKEFTFDNLQKLKNLDYVADVYPRHMEPYVLGQEQNNEEIKVEFLHEDYDIKKFYNIELTETAPFGLFGVYVEEDLFKKINEPTTFEMAGRHMRVAGTFKAKHTDLEKAVLVQRDMYEALFGSEFDTVDVMMKENVNKQLIERLKLDVMTNFAESHNVKHSEDTKKEITSVIGTIMNLFLIFGVLTVVVSGIGIMNLTYIMVSNERNQICIKRAVGASAFDITKEYLLKIFWLTLRGTILGIGVGLGATYLVALVNNMEIAISPLSIIISFGFSFGLSFIFGIYPVHSVSKENIVNFL